MPPSLKIVNLDWSTRGDDNAPFRLSMGFPIQILHCSLWNITYDVQASPVLSYRQATWLATWPGPCDRVGYPNYIRQTVRVISYY